MLWLSLYFPHLSLDLCTRGRRTEARSAPPVAIYVTTANRQWVYDRNCGAAELGIESGMALGAALSLCASLQARPRDEDAELAALKSIAVWAGQFTSTVSLQPPQGLLLEIEGSLMLFGGIHALQERMETGLQELGYHAGLAVAPTPLGAWLLARAGHTEPVTDKPTLARLLRKLSIGLLERTDYVLNALQGMGLRTIGDCLRLPRDGLARRLGPELVHYLDRALGRIADPRPAFTPPERFASRVLLPAEVDDTAGLLFALRRLLLELGGFLLARGSGVQGLVLQLLHTDQSPTQVEVGLVSPSRAPGHLLELLREHLDRLELTAPVEAIAVHADKLLPLDQRNTDLFSDSWCEPQAWPQLAERLRARLGQDAVRGLCLVATHRPERAWRYCRPGEKGLDAASLPRPLWMLQKPLPLEITGGHLWLNGRLLLEQGPERIESGWWEGVETARDYFVAENPRHERFWIFRELQRPQQWFLHGIFS